MITTDTLFTETLDNGLKVFILQDISTPLFVAKLYVRTGSLNETPHLGYGLSHFLEHLVAGGKTEKRSEKDYQDEIALMGGAYNAYTTLDHTCYYLNTLPKFANNAIDILYEWAFLNTFTSKEFNREKAVITREIERDKVSIPRQFHKTIQEAFYTHHPSRYPVLGYLENFLSVTPDLLKNYYKKTYVPANMTLVIGGNTDPDKLMAHINQTFGSQAYITAPPAFHKEQPLPFADQVIEKNGDTSVTFLALRFHSIGLQHPDLYALDALDYVLGNGENALLYKHLVEKTKLAYSISTASYTPAYGGGYFDIIAQVDAQNCRKAESEIKAIITSIQTKKMSEVHLAQAKKQKQAEDILDIENIEDKIEKIGQGIMAANDPDFYAKYTEKFSRVTVEQVQAVAKKYLDFSKVLTVRFFPKENPTQEKKCQKKAQFVQKIPQKFTLKNGIRVLIYPDSSRPSVQGKCYLLGGIRAETAQNNGIGQLIAQLYAKKSEVYSKKAILDLVEGNGADMSAAQGLNTFYVNLECLSEDLETLLPVWADTILNPKFPDAEIKLAKKKQLKAISQRHDDWYSSSSYEFKKRFFDPHPYRLSIIGEKESVNTLTEKELSTFYRAMLDPKKMIITLFGDVNTQESLKKLETLFSSLNTPKIELSFPNQNRKPHTQSTQKNLSIIQDVVAVYLAFDGTQFSQQDDVLGLEIVSALLCGVGYPAGRYHRQLREAGLVYQVHGVHQVGIEAGSLMFCALTHQAGLEKTKKFMLHQAKELCEKKVSEEEFKQAQAQLQYMTQERLATWDGLAVSAATQELFGVGFDHYLTLQERIEQLTPQDAFNAAKKFLINPQVYIFSKKEQQ